jgi:hypothetical protein
MLRFRWNRIDWARSLPDSSQLKRAELGGFSELINLSAGFLKEYLLFRGRDGIALLSSALRISSFYRKLDPEEERPRLP